MSTCNYNKFRSHFTSNQNLNLILTAHTFKMIINFPVKRFNTPRNIAPYKISVNTNNNFNMLEYIILYDVVHNMCVHADDDHGHKILQIFAQTEL